MSLGYLDTQALVSIAQLYKVTIKG